MSSNTQTTSGRPTRPTIELADGTEIPARLTIIANIDGEELKVEHFHLSVGATNEDTVNQELTT